MFGLSDYPDAIIRGAALGLITLVWVILVARVIGLRTFSKMTSFDFVITLATGSLLASAATVTEWTALVQALSAILALLIAQLMLARARRGSRTFQLMIENDPIMLMHNGKILEGALAKTRVSESDVLYEIRLQGIRDLSHVRSMVLESTGDISIISGETGPTEEVMKEVDCCYGPEKHHTTREK